MVLLSVHRNRPNIAFEVWVEGTNPGGLRLEFIVSVTWQEAEF